MRSLIKGYSAKCRIDDHDVLATSFDLSIDENIVNSEGAARILVQDRFKRFSLNALRDYPSYELSMSFESQFEIFKYFIELLTSKKVASFMKVYFTDPASGINFRFDQSVLRSFNVNVPNGSNAVISVSFIMFYDIVDISFPDHTVYQGDIEEGSNGSSGDGDSFFGDHLMPYWAWGVEMHYELPGGVSLGFKDNDMYEFSWSFQQTVTPVYGCQGLSDSFAFPPMKITVGVPVVAFDLTYVVATSSLYTDVFIDSNKITNSNICLIVSYNKYDIIGSRPIVEMLPVDDEFIIDEADEPVPRMVEVVVGMEPVYDEIKEFQYVLNDAYIHSISPQVASKDSVNMIKISGQVYGKIDTVKDKPEEE